MGRGRGKGRGKGLGSMGRGMGRGKIRRPLELESGVLEMRAVAVVGVLL